MLQMHLVMWELLMRFYFIVYHHHSMYNNERIPLEIVVTSTVTLERTTDKYVVQVEQLPSDSPMEFRF